MKKIIILVIFFLAAGIQIMLTPRSVSLGPGVMVFEEPVQQMIEDPVPFEVDDYTFTPKADFSVTAKVLHRKRYYLDEGAKLSPIDLALGWGNMSDEAVLGELNISQGDRFFLWNCQTLPIPVDEIIRSAANMHMIPANPEVKKAILSARKGEIVEFSGQLVYIMRDDGWHWKSSLTRNDSGGGACEVVWVEEFSVLPAE